MGFPKKIVTGTVAIKMPRNLNSVFLQIDCLKILGQSFEFLYAL